MRSSLLSALVASGVSLSATVALAGPTYTFSASEGVQPNNVGTITLTQVNPNTVDILVDLSDPKYGFMNSGGKHTPFAFTLNGGNSGLAITFIQPINGSYPGKNNSTSVFSLNPNGGEATPFGVFGVAIDSTAGNGSAEAYYGDLEFKLSRTGGLSTSDFIVNDAKDLAYFAADLTNGKDTGSQAWKLRDPTTVTNTPEPASLAVIGATLFGLGLTRRRRQPT